MLEGGWEVRRESVIVKYPLTLNKYSSEYELLVVSILAVPKGCAKQINNMTEVPFSI